MAKTASNLAGVVSMAVKPTTGKYGGISIVSFNPKQKNPVNKQVASGALFAQKPFSAKPFGGVLLPMKSSTGFETHQVSATHEAETVEAPVAIVTNANRGPGRAIALAYIKAGFKVLLHYSGQGLEPKGMVDVYDEIMAMGGTNGLITQCDLSDKDMTAQTFEAVLDHFFEEEVEVGKLIQKLGGKATIFNGDLSQKDIVAEMFTLALNEFGTVDILVNYPGEVRANACFEDVIYSSLVSACLCTEEFEKIMMEKGKGRIINVPSVDGTVGEKGVAYDIAQQGLKCFTKSAAMKYKERFQVNVMVPGTDEYGVTITGLRKYEPFPYDAGQVAIYMAIGGNDFTGQLVYFTQGPMI